MSIIKILKMQRIFQNLFTECLLHTRHCARDKRDTKLSKERKESYKTIVSGKSRNGEVSVLVCSFITKDFVYSWVLESEKVAMLDPSLLWGREFMYVWWVLEKMRKHKENTSISAQWKWEDGITDVPEAKKGKM